MKCEHCGEPITGLHIVDGCPAESRKTGRMSRDEIIELPCAGTCARTIRVTDTTSLYQPDGVPHQIFCSHCYHEKETQA